MSDHSQRGETSAQTVILLPALLLMLWVGVHVALLLHSANVASAVAEVVSRRAAANGGADTATLDALATETAAELAATLDGKPTARWTNDVVVVTVSVRGPSLVPFLPDSVTRSAAVPLERFLTEEQRR